MSRPNWMHCAALAVLVPALFAFPAAAARPGGSTTSCPRPYTLTSLPAEMSGAIDINDAGMVLGQANRICFVTAAGAITGMTPFTAPGRPERMNELGWVLGHVTESTAGYGYVRPWLLIPDDLNGDGVGDRWTRDDNGDGLNDLVQMLPVPAGIGYRDVVAHDVNEAGVVVGYASFSFGNRPLVWTRDGAGAWLVDLIGASGSDARDINSEGWTVGGRDGEAVLWMLDETGLTLDEHGMGDLGGTESLANAVNRGGDVAGEALVAGSGLRHAFLVVPQDTDGDGTADTWLRDDNGDGANDLMTDLGFLGSAFEAWAYAVNDSRQVVGRTYGPGAGAAFLWENGRIYEIAKCASGGGNLWNTTADAINNRGQVIVHGRDGRRGDFKSWVLSPQ